MKKIAKLLVMLAASSTYMGFAGHAWSASLGTLRVLSAPGKSFLAEIDVEDIAAVEQASLAVAFADAQAHHRAQLEYSNLLSKLKLEIVKNSNTQSAIVRISSSEVIDAPFLEALIDLSWHGGKQRQEYFFPLAKSQASALIKPSQPLVAPVAIESLVVQPIKSQRKLVASTKDQAKDQVKDPSKDQAKDKIKDSVADQSKKLSDVSGKPEAGARYQVKQGDSLSGIARQSAKDQRSIDVMMAAIFEANDSAFTSGNIHQLRTGSELSIPSHEQAAKFTTSQAVELLAKHDHRGGYYERAAAARQGSSETSKLATKTDEEKTQLSKVKESPEQESLQATKSEKLASEDQLKLSRSTVASPSITDKNAMEDDLVIKDKALKEASDRIVALEKNISDLQRLLELKNSTQQASQAEPTQVPTVKKPWYQQPIVLALGVAALLAAIVKLLSKKTKKISQAAKNLR